MEKYELTNGTMKIYKITKQDIKNIIKNNLWCVSKSNPVLRGIFLDNDNAVSTDGIRLSITKINKTGLKHVIPINVFKDLVKSKHNKWFITLQKDTIIFKVPNSLMPSKKSQIKILDYDYPNYKTVLPKESKLTININKNQFLRSLEAIIQVSKADTEKLKITSLTIKSSIISFHTAHIQYKKVKTKIPITIYPSDLKSELLGSDNKFTIYFNAKYMKQAIKACQYNDIEMCFTSKTAPIFINDYKYTHLLMPISIEGGKVVIK